jgi:hypothetical protein
MRHRWLSRYRSLHRDIFNLSHHVLRVKTLFILSEVFENGREGSFMATIVVFILIVDERIRLLLNCIVC